MKIENIYIKRDSEGNITGDIEISKNGRFDCVCFGIYTSGNFEFKTWNTRKFTKKEKKLLILRLSQNSPLKNFAHGFLRTRAKFMIN